MHVTRILLTAAALILSGCMILALHAHGAEPACVTPQDMEMYLKNHGVTDLVVTQLTPIEAKGLAQSGHISMADKVDTGAAFARKDIVFFVPLDGEGCTFSSTGERANDLTEVQIYRLPLKVFLKVLHEIDGTAM